MAEFFTKIKSLWDQINGINPLPICTCNGCSCNLTRKFLKAQQEERLIQLLMKLDDKFVNIRTNILMMQPLPNVSLAYRLLIQEENQRIVAQLQGESSNTMGFLADYRKGEYRRHEYKPNRPPLQSNNYSSPSNYRTNGGYKKNSNIN